MKKIMILAAVAMAAFASQAAAISWTTEKLYAPGADGAFTGTLLKNAEYASFSVDITFYNKNGVALTGVENTSSSKFAKSGAVTATTSGYDFLVGTDYQYSAKYTLVMDGKTYTMDVANTTFTQDMSTGNYSLSVPSASSWTVQATDVPEPTSGLLLLLGVAGLALRRKQK